MVAGPGPAPNVRPCAASCAPPTDHPLGSRSSRSRTRRPGAGSGGGCGRGRRGELHGRAHGRGDVPDQDPDAVHTGHGDGRGDRPRSGTAWSTSRSVTGCSGWCSARARVARGGAGRIAGSACRTQPRPRPGGRVGAELLHDVVLPDPPDDGAVPARRCWCSAPVVASGSPAVDVAHALGAARVIAAASTTEKLDGTRALRRHGRHQLRDGGPQGPGEGALRWRRRCRGRPGRRRPGRAGARAAGWNGRFLVIGFAGGIEKLPANLVLLNNRTLIGVDWGAGPDGTRRVSGRCSSICLPRSPTVDCIRRSRTGSASRTPARCSSRCSTVSSSARRSSSPDARAPPADPPRRRRCRCSRESRSCPARPR